LYTLAKVNAGDEMPEKSSAWRKSCEETLMIPVYSTGVDIR
jgi:hypothetical protein